MSEKQLTSPNQEPSSVDQEVYDQSPADGEAVDVEQILFENKELLGGSKRIKAEIHTAGYRVIEGVQVAMAGVKNTFTSPKKAWYTLTRNRSERALERRQDRAGLAKSGLINNLRSKRVEGAQVKLDQHQTRLDDYNAVRQERYDEAHESAQEKREAYTESLVDKKAQALARKALRKELREEDTSRSERKEVLGIISPEKLAQVGKAAIYTETARRRLRAGERRERRAGSKQERLGEKYNQVVEKAEDYEREVAETGQRLDDLLSPERLEEVEQAQEKLARDEEKLESLDEDDPRVSELEDAVAKGQALLDEHSAEVNEHSELRRLAVERERNADETRARAEKIGGKRDRVGRRLGRVSAEAARLQKLRASLDGELGDAVDEALSPAVDPEEAAAAGTEAESEAAESSDSSPPEAVDYRIDREVERLFSDGVAVGLMKQGKSFGTWVDSTRDRWDTLGPLEKNRLEDAWPKYAEYYNKK